MIPIDHKVKQIRGYRLVGKSFREIGLLVSMGEASVLRLCKKHKIFRPAWLPKKLTPVERVWVAAVIDCEGCVLVHTPPTKTGKRCIQIQIRVAMVCALIPKRIHQLCGGHLTGPIMSGKQNKRPQFLWTLPPNGCRWLLPQIKNFMFTKKRHAEIVLQILTENNHSTAMEFNRLVAFITEIKKLNCKGAMQKPLAVPSGELRRRNFD